MRRVTFKTFYVFVRHGHPQHACDGWEVNNCLRYCAHFILSNISLGDSISFSYDASYSIHQSTPYSIGNDDGDDEITPSYIHLQDYQYSLVF